MGILEVYIAGKATEIRVHQKRRFALNKLLHPAPQLLGRVQAEGTLYRVSGGIARKTTGGDPDSTELIMIQYSCSCSLCMLEWSRM